ncbi:MAG: hypothetical protein M1826_007460 [Phylliscum demangeonii]|nr:MAG: hypothetical protein M1826_007460 [Phylliscum demangeonii]
MEQLALPAITTLQGCADFRQTVQVFLPQLLALPRLLAASPWSFGALKAIYLATNPLITSLAFTLFTAPLFLLAAEVNDNYSQVDRFWSILPSIYHGHYALYAHLAGLSTQRLDTLLAISVLWSARLTFNYYRKGGYSVGSEDYRWAVLRRYISPPLFFLFDAVFIATIQPLLLFLITTPTYALLLASRLTGDHFTTTDLIVTRLMAGIIIFEFFADQQQWDYQVAKRTYQRTAKPPKGYTATDLDRGFVVTGLWAWSPFWILLYQYAALVTDSLYNWTLAGALAYVALFRASTWFTELISARKYPVYREYQRRVGMFVPKVFGGGMDGEGVGEGDGEGDEDEVEDEDEDEAVDGVRSGGKAAVKTKPKTARRAPNKSRKKA